MHKKQNFRNPLEVEKFIYKTMKMLQEKQISGNDARAASQLANSWLKAHESRKVIEFEQRIVYLETESQMQRKKGSK